MAEPAAIQESIHLVHLARDSDGQAYPDFFLHLTFEFVEEEGLWCGHCVELGTAAFSATREEARNELLQATNIQLAEVEKLNELEKHLEQNNVSLYAIPKPGNDTELAHEEAVFAEAVPA